MFRGIYVVKVWHKAFACISSKWGAKVQIKIDIRKYSAQKKSAPKCAFLGLGCAGILLGERLPLGGIGSSEMLRFPQGLEILGDPRGLSVFSFQKDDTPALIFSNARSVRRERAYRSRSCQGMHNVPSTDGSSSTACTMNCACRR